MEIKDIGTISSSGRKTHVYMGANDTAQAEVPSDCINPGAVAQRALMLYLAEREWKTGESILSARHRVREYLRENPPVLAGEGKEIVTGKPTYIYREA